MISLIGAAMACTLGAPAPGLAHTSPLALQQAAPPAFEDVQVTPPSSPPAAAPAPPAPTTAPIEAEPKAEAKLTPGPSGWTPGEGFVLTSNDGSHNLRIGMQTAYKFEPTYQDGDWVDRRAFFVLRPIFAGTFYKKWIRFWTSLELNSNPPYLLDSYIELQPVDEFGVRLGQQYTLISRHEQFGPQQILFPEWAPVAEYFWTGRDKGATAWGLLADKAFEYYAGAYSGSPLRQFTTISGNYVLEGRLVWNLFGPPGSNEFPYIAEERAPFRISTSIQGYYGKVQLAEENFNPSSFRFDVMPTGVVREQSAGVVDVFVQGPLFAFLAEGYYRRTDPETMVSDDSYKSIGVWGQLGFLILPRSMDAAIRVNWLDPSTTLNDDQFLSGEAQLAYYITHSPHLVLKVRYAVGEQKSPGMDALGAVPLFTRPGKFQLGTVQLNLMF